MAARDRLIKAITRPVQCFGCLVRCSLGRALNPAGWFFAAGEPRWPESSAKHLRNRISVDGDLRAPCVPCGAAAILPNLLDRCAVTKTWRSELAIHLETLSYIIGLLQRKSGGTRRLSTPRFTAGKSGLPPKTSGCLGVHHLDRPVIVAMSRVRMVQMSVHQNGWCAGLHPVGVSRHQGGFLYVRARNRVGWYDAPAPPAPGEYDDQPVACRAFCPLGRGPEPGFCRVAAWFLGWVEEYEGWIEAACGPGYRRRCFERAPLPWLPPGEGRAWLASYRQELPVDPASHSVNLPAPNASLS